ncbi:hypothetical protein BDN70DRAFT_932808 [Pholiota conissans]|uniref:Uncharacterized protein n=1 Tax=Pholiota conissans TaxID=109636 RepID=A0A9P5Z1J7_9AGAR|nr:hypothetical protein BDN70DRAFT_932808 [Pholiota conissans]
MKVVYLTVGENEQSHVDTPTETIDLVESKSPVLLTPPVPKDTNSPLPLAKPSSASGAQVLSPISGTVMEKVAQKSTGGHALRETISLTPKDLASNLPLETQPSKRARTKITARKSTGGHAPRKPLPFPYL